jgi:hypothetical protein
MASKQKADTSAGQASSPEAPLGHEATVSKAIHAMRKLVQDNPEFGDQLRLAATTDDVHKLLEAKGIDITAEDLWQHRGSLLGDGNLTWRG